MKKIKVIQFSPAWWLGLTLIGAAGVWVFYVFYVALWEVLG